ncbi:MAG: putative PEP-binding protein [Planctomycetota bacterium]
MPQATPARLPAVSMDNDHDLLLTLEDVSQLVSHSHNRQETFQNICELMQRRFRTAVCSIYIAHPQREELVLAATVGLNPEGIGRVRMSFSEGLTGLVAQTMAPVVETDAPRHPRFKYFKETGEDPFRTFVGVPLLEAGTLRGVLVVQTVEHRDFGLNDVRMLKTVAAQLSSLVQDAWWLDQVGSAAHDTAPAREATAWQAKALSPGTGIGRAYVIDGFDEYRKALGMKSESPEREMVRLDNAIAGAREELVSQERAIAELLGEDHGAILQAQRMILQDNGVVGDLRARVRSGLSAEASVLDTLDQYVAAFQKVSAPLMQERIFDIKDVFIRTLWRLQGGRSGPTDSRSPLVLVLREASVLELFAVDRKRLAGVVVEHGGPQCHAAILARSLGLPMVGQVADFASLATPGRWLRVDGTAGKVEAASPLAADSESFFAEPVEAIPAGAPAGAPAGPAVEATVNLFFEAAQAWDEGARAIGLFRSEFLFLARRTVPTEDEQERIYRKLILAMRGGPVCIRTFDLRPDKAGPMALPGQSARGFDWRLVLDSPPMRRLFREQVRAIVRAAEAGPARLLIPLVSATELLDFACETLAEARASLAREGLADNTLVELGIMVENAGALPLLPQWLPRVDFVSLGTNDLFASALGVSRDDPVAGVGIDFLHPGLLRIIHGVIREASALGKPVTVCGEMAADPLGAIALASLGASRLSVPVRSLRQVRKVLASRLGAPADELARALLAATRASEVRALLASHNA